MKIVDTNGLLIIYFLKYIYMIHLLNSQRQIKAKNH